MGRMGVVTASLVAGLLCAISSASSAGHLSAEAIASMYGRLAFEDEYALAHDAKAGRNFSMRLDIGRPINVVVLPNAGSPPALVDHVHELVAAITADLTSHAPAVHFEIVSQNMMATYAANREDFARLLRDNTLAIYIRTRQQMRDLVLRAGGDGGVFAKTLSVYEPGGISDGFPACFALLMAEPPGLSPVIIGASIFVEEPYPDIETCLYEEMMQSFGLGFDFPAGTASIFNDDQVYLRPTNLDWTLWRIHNDPAMLPGMNRADAVAKAATIAAVILAE